MEPTTPTPIDLPRQIKLARRAREQQQIHETKAADAAVTLAEALTSARTLCPPAPWPAVLANLELSEGLARDLLANNGWVPPGAQAPRVVAVFALRNGPLSRLYLTQLAEERPDA